VSDKRAEHRKRSPSAGYTVPEAGRMVGLSKNAAYEAAKRGEIPTLKFGHRIIVPRAIRGRKLGLGPVSPRGDA
jgi:hypothetical protein